MQPASGAMARMTACKHCGAGFQIVGTDDDGSEYLDSHECSGSIIADLKQHIDAGTLPAWDWLMPLVMEHLYDDDWEVEWMKSLVRTLEFKRAR